MTLSVYLVAGEPSGDRLGGALMAGLRMLQKDIAFLGVGGELMQRQGLNTLFPMSDLSVMGIAEIIPKYRMLKRRIRETAEDILAKKPDIVVTIDSPDFNKRVARIVKARSKVKIVHYVAPSVWAWRPGRAAKLAKLVDHVLALLPFEPPYMEAVGLGCTFVGHPVVAEPQANPLERDAFRARLGLGPDAPLLLALPGSRRGEVARLATVFRDALAGVVLAHPDARVVIPAAAPVAGLVTELCADWPGNPLIIDPRELRPEAAAAEKRAAFGAADVALAASGTVSLELAAAETPMAIAYRMNLLSFHLIRRMALIDSVTLVNLVTETRTVPEFLGPDCKAEPIAAALNALLSNGDKRKAQLTAMRQTMARIGAGDKEPGLRAAEAVLRQL